MSISPSQPKTLYFSPFDKFSDCAQAWLWGRGYPTVDLGYGLGKPKPKPVKKSEHHAVMGTALQGVIELFYNSTLYLILPPQQLFDRLMELAEESFKAECSRRYIDWGKCPPKDEMLRLVKEGIRGYMRTLKAHRLLGPYARAEVDLVGYVDKYTPIGGRADVIIRRDDTGVTIIDGKNSKRYKDGKGGLMTYTNPDQLRWYALCYYLAYRKLPDRLGFVFYRYPYGSPMLDLDGFPVLDATGNPRSEEGVSWVSFTMEDIKGLGQRAVEVVQAMHKEQFGPKPSPKTCKFCDYETVCPERQAQKAANKRAPKGDSPVKEGGPMIFSFGEDGTLVK